METINARLAEKGYTPTSYGVGESGLFPFRSKAHWIFDRPDTLLERVRAKAAVFDVTWSLDLTVGAVGEQAKGITTDVIKPTIATAVPVFSLVAVVVGLGFLAVFLRARGT